MKAFLSGMEKNEIANRARGMQEQELTYFLKCIPTSYLLEEIGRRESVIVDKLNILCTRWDELTIDKPITEMNILEKEDLFTQLRRCLYYGNE